jgi:hypothetical protein
VERQVHLPTAIALISARSLIQELAAFPPLYVWGPVLLFGGLLFVLQWGMSRIPNRWYLMGFAGMVMASFLSVAIGHTALWNRMLSTFVP